MVVEEAASKRLVHKITHYIDELAYALHSYYNNEKVVSDDINQTFEKATVLKAVSIVLKDALALMGISAPTQM
jgi:arginyl-tRNA synthetase